MRKDVDHKSLLCSREGAGRFGEAFPLGNGQIGAMVYGGLPRNRIALSENTFFSGNPFEDNNREGASRVFLQMRDAALKKDFEKVHELAKGFIGRKNNYGTNLPVGDLWVEYERTGDKLSLKERSLCIQTGVATRQVGDIEEQIFASHPEHCLVYGSKSTRPYTCRLGLTDLTCGGIERIFIHQDRSAELVWRANAWEEMHCQDKIGVELVGRLKIFSDGIIREGEEALEIVDCSVVHAYLYMETDYQERMGRKKAYKGRESVCTKSYDDIYREHICDVSSLMTRCELWLPGQEDIGFLFQYGRYLLLSSVREDSALPPHLQGIWNDNVACRIGWSCDMHLDINTQMNYWPALPTGLEETLPPLWNWMEKSLIPEGRKTARDSYGMPGWVGELVSNAWGYSAPYWASPLSPCPTGGSWMLSQLWQHYLYTDSKDMLQRLYPMYQEAVEFFDTYLFEHEGKLLSGPSISPENTFRWKGGDYQISISPTYEILMIRELFEEYREIIQKLPCKEDDLHLTEVLKKLPWYRVLEDGTLAEYWEDMEIPDKQHRHTSHLLGVYPFRQIDSTKTPELAKAVVCSINQKTHPEEIWEDTGWARSLLALYEARLMRGNEAEYHLRKLISGLLEPNHMIYHPPTRGAGAFDHVYELDGNTGFTAAVAEMLLQAYDDKIILLPALPETWEEGSVKGLRAIGGIRVNMSWEKGQIREIELWSPKKKRIELWYNREKIIVELEACTLWSRA